MKWYLIFLSIRRSIESVMQGENISNIQFEMLPFLKGGCIRMKGQLKILQLHRLALPASVVGA